VNHRVVVGGVVVSWDSWPSSDGIWPARIPKSRAVFPGCLIEERSLLFWKGASCLQFKSFLTLFVKDLTDFCHLLEKQGYRTW